MIVIHLLKFSEKKNFEKNDYLFAKKELIFPLERNERYADAVTFPSLPEDARYSIDYLDKWCDRGQYVGAISFKRKTRVGTRVSSKLLISVLMLLRTFRFSPFIFTTARHIRANFINFSILILLSSLRG